MELTQDEYTAIGQAITIITCPTTKWSRDNRGEVSKKLLNIMAKYMPKEN